MWKNADVPSSEVHPQVIKPSGTAPYYTKSKKTNEFKIYNETYTYAVQMYPYPLLINPSATEPYYTMSVSHVEECRHTYPPANQT